MRCRPGHRVLVAIVPPRGPGCRDWVVRCDRPLRHSYTTMRAIKIAFLISLAATNISSAWAEENEGVKKDLAQLQGEWSMVSGSADGRSMPDQMRKQMKRI